MRRQASLRQLVGLTGHCWCLECAAGLARFAVVDSEIRRNDRLPILVILSSPKRSFNKNGALRAAVPTFPRN